MDIKNILTSISCIIKNLVLVRHLSDFFLCPWLGGASEHADLCGLIIGPKVRGEHTQLFQKYSQIEMLALGNRVKGTQIHNVNKSSGENRDMPCVTLKSLINAQPFM